MSLIWVVAPPVVIAVVIVVVEWVDDEQESILEAATSHFPAKLFRLEMPAAEIFIEGLAATGAPTSFDSVSAP